MVNLLLLKSVFHLSLVSSTLNKIYI